MRWKKLWYVQQRMAENHSRSHDGLLKMLGLTEKYSCVSSAYNWQEIPLNQFFYVLKYKYVIKNDIFSHGGGKDKRRREKGLTQKFCVQTISFKDFILIKKRLNFRGWSFFSVRYVCPMIEGRTKLSRAQQIFLPRGLWRDDLCRFIAASLSAVMLMIFNLFRKILSYSSAKCDTTKKRE